MGHPEDGGEQGCVCFADIRAWESEAVCDRDEEVAVWLIILPESYVFF